MRNKVKNKAVWLMIIIAAALLAVGFSGCGEPNSQSVFNPETGTHPANWIIAHNGPALSNPELCTECHGSDLTGGISVVSCLMCHTAGSPYALTNCASCHEKPPTGVAYPNRAGAHAEHNALPHVTDVCDTCHHGAGSGTVLHYDNVVEAAFLPAYNAESGTASFNSADNTCANVSCHGGQTTPDWFTGSIDVATQCTACHVFGTAPGAPQYNSYYSGRHSLHVFEEHKFCTDCHDTTKLAVSHFTNLNTPVMEGLASATIKDSIQYRNGTCLTPPCHGAENWFGGN